MDYNITYGDLIDSPEVVSLVLAKKNSEIEDSTNDAYYSLLLEASVQDAENYVGSTFLKRNVDVSLSEWPSDFTLPLFPVQSITNIEYKDVDGTTQTVNAADYELYSQLGANRIRFKWESTPDLEEGNVFPITIKCVAGYDNNKMPSAVKSAVLLRFSHKERFREDVPTSYNRSFYAALRPFKRWK